MHEFITEYCKNRQIDMEDAIEKRIYTSFYINSVEEALDKITPEWEPQKLMWELWYHKGMTDVVNHINNSNLTDSQQAVKYVIEKTDYEIVVSETMREVEVDDIDDDVISLIIDFQNVVWEKEDIEYNFELVAQAEDFGYGLYDENGNKQGHIDAEDVVYYKETE